jgi:PhnB protein
MSVPNHVVNPYLFFGGRCQEALDFYREAVGAKVEMLMKFNESPDPVPEGMLAPGYEDKIMHSRFLVGDTALLASDGCNEGDGGFHGFSLALSVPDEAAAHRAFDALAAGGSVGMPLTKTFWSPLYGMVKDKFGLHWMVMVPAPMP